MISDIRYKVVEQISNEEELEFVKNFFGDKK